ncbi:type IV secretion protein Rhs [Herbaspirillum rubrisubalbicans]|uniref:Type IV secretion protein Rhs n=1 Tax=Herbaspirillum rubrisubalbicans TaxID=80842 RepID=A0ABX9C875_9BURK|nr:type VI secretion system tip protein VgrG [Herbaspirillum rubrisubalbicans]NQE46909.1 type IV secretion protein Rhs [Herbaspirillum rubrisubalbicans]RAM67133.1 type IV secretion protein Rhs [Herbaspirillum rubrisubalbicans]RAN49002.1 type IV secretion protein Rhs [Herbaspirillum rubrisubalbicans]
MNSPVIGSVITYQVKANGAVIPDTCQILSIRVKQGINRISGATLVILDGDPAQEDFTVSASSTFVPGNTVSIAVGYDATNVIVFEGIVIKQALRVENEHGPVLEVECKDKAIQMTIGRKSCAWSKSKDSDAISALISQAGLSASVSATTTNIPELVQYYVSDWDFMLSRAEVNSMVVSTINNKVSVFDPTAQTSPVMTASYGSNLLAFHAELNALTQLAKVTATAWDYQTQKLINAEAGNNLAGPGNLSSKTLAGVAKLDNFTLQTSAAQSNDELTSWAKAQMLKSELSKITGTVRLQGTSLLLPGAYLTLKGLGARFDGDHFVSGVQHELVDGNWVTEASIGLSARWFHQDFQVEAPAAAGNLPGIQGLYNATVKQIDNDPDNEYRILVELALFNDKGTGLWARLSNFYSTSGQGVFFLPEVNDEVIVGFLNQDPRYPIILGSLYSQKNKPYQALTPNAKNSMKAIVSKSELRILFDDENKVLSLITPSNNTIVLDDKNKQISIQDEHANSIVMSASGIAIKSPKTISLEADQAVSIKGNTGVTVSSSGGDVATKGVNITETANMQYTAKGNMEAAVQGGVQLTLKAAMVMIN